MHKERPDPYSPEADKAACYRYTGFFTGQNPAYTHMPFQVSYAIMRHLRENFGINARTPYESVATLLGMLVLTVYKAVGKSAADEADWQHDLDDMIARCVEALTGGGDLLPGDETG